MAQKSLSQMTTEELWQLFPIFLTEHNPEWQVWFKEEKAALKSILPFDCRIYHIGSTAVKGIRAKPIVDILLVTAAERMKDAARILQNNGYIVMAESAERISLNKGYTENGYAERVFHLHIRLPEDTDEIYFAEYLNSHAQVAAEYEKLKLELSKIYRHNRDAYTSAKTDFVKKYTQAAKQSASRQ